MAATPLNPGMVVAAKVARIESYGVFFKHCDGAEILVLITEMKQGVVEHPSDLVEIGEEVDLKILRRNQGGDGYAATMLIGD